MTRMIGLALLMTLVACGGEDEGTEPTGSAPVGSQPTAGGGGGGGGGASATPSWTGTWMVEIDWEVSCEYPFQAPDVASGSDSWSLVLYGPANDLEVVVDHNDWYTMSGSADDDGIRLCGTFPMWDAYDDVASVGPENNICIDIDRMDGADLGSGTAKGRFEGSFGADCELFTSTAVIEQ